MKLIIGLGNPGTKYQKNRHNVGFMVIDEIIQKNNLRFKKCERTSSERIESIIGQHKIMLAKPQTFMNNSGRSVDLLMHYYKVKPENTWVIFDDVDLPLGKIRIRHQGSAGPAAPDRARRDADAGTRSDLRLAGRSPRRRPRVPGPTRARRSAGPLRPPGR